MFKHSIKSLGNLVSILFLKEICLGLEIIPDELRISFFAEFSPLGDQRNNSMWLIPRILVEKMCQNHLIRADCQNKAGFFKFFYFPVWPNLANSYCCWLYDKNENKNPLDEAPDDKNLSQNPYLLIISKHFYPWSGYNSGIYMYHNEW